jgi:5-methyltetrahydrofolate--homocysteine methyltransferase
MAERGNFLERLRAGEVLLSDGAWGTELQKMGLPAGSCPEEWNVSHPDEVRRLVRGYLDAGADMVLTNSFGGTRFRLRRHGFAERVGEFNQAAARLSKEAAAPYGAFVVASVGPTGEFVEPLGLVTEQEMKEAFREQIQALKDGGADAIVVETVFALEEMRLAIGAAKDLGMTCFATMTFDLGAAGFKTMMGVSVPQAAKALEEYGADVVGSNCGNGIENMVRIAAEMRAHTRLPILVHPNAGMPQLVQGQVVYQEAPEAMAGKLKELIAAGANIVGGCCGTTPAHIKAFREVLDGIKNRVQGLGFRV